VTGIANREICYAPFQGAGRLAARGYIDLMRRLALLPLLLLSSACFIPATAHAPLVASPTDAFRCAAGTLTSRGYTIVDADETGLVVRAERPRHATVPGHGESDVDRITVTIGRGRDAQMHARGDTDREPGAPITGGPRRGGRFVGPMSREIYADTDAVVKNCAGSETTD